MCTFVPGWWQPAPWSRWHYIIGGRAVCADLCPGKKPPAYFGGPLSSQPGGPTCTHCDRAIATRAAIIVNGG